MKFVASALILLVCSLAFSQEAQPETHPGLTLGKAVSVSNVTIFPILSLEAAEPDRPTTLGEAGRSGLLEIYFSGRTVAVHNGSDAPLLIAAGEILAGGHQDQVVDRDVVLQPGITAAIDTLCIEPGRSQGPNQLMATYYLVPQWMRGIEVAGSTRMLQPGDAQQQIWNNVMRLNRAHGDPPLGTVRTPLEDGVLAGESGALASRLATPLDETKNAVGFLLCINGQIVSAEMFGSHELCAKYREALLKCYASTALLVGTEEGKQADTAECQRFIETVSTSTRKQISKSNTGSFFRVSGKNLLGVETGADSFVGKPGGVDRTGFIHGLYFRN